MALSILVCFRSTLCVLIQFHSIELAKHERDLAIIDKDCPCPTCVGGTSRALLHHLITQETAGAHGKQILKYLRHPFELNPLSYYST